MSASAIIHQRSLKVILRWTSVVGLALIKLRTQTCLQLLEEDHLGFPKNTQ
jgi:hypothetical protein